MSENIDKERKDAKMRTGILTKNSRFEHEAIKMKAHDSFLTTLLKSNNATFNIPVYQRNYDWDAENCKQLFQDLETIVATGKEHFIGSIVYISIGVATEPYYNIIDGQQRITSVMLFLKALHDSTDDERLKKMIQRGFLINYGIDDEPKVRLKQIESDRTVFERLIAQENFSETSYSETEKLSNVYRNYEAFKEYIQQSTFSMNELYNAVYKLEIIDVCLTTEDPQEVFESMNSTGRSLTNADLLRNYLLMDLDGKQQDLLYKKYWTLIEKNVGAKQMDQFMVHYLIMNRKSDSMNLRRKRSKINKTTLYECFKIYFPPESKLRGGTENLLKDMSRYSKIYHIIMSNSTKTELDRAFAELIYDLNGEPAIVFLMYLLHLHENAEISDKELLDAVKACISYVFRVRMFKGSVSAQFFALAIQHFEKCDSMNPFIDRVWSALVSGAGSYRFPRDKEFRDAFENKNMYIEFKPPMLRYILYAYEKEETKDRVPVEGATIEHILPQDSREWRQHLSEIHDNDHYELVHRIGNLTLTKMNSEASNYPFEKKKAIYEKSGFTITRDLTRLQDWNSNEIKKRSAKMADKALELWPLPSKYNIDQGDSSSVMNMSDETEELFNQFRETISEFNPSVYEEPKKIYINFMIDKKIICCLIPLQNSLSVILNVKSGYFDADEMLEDISGKGHWGTGDYRMRIEKEADVQLALEYIKRLI